MSGDGLNRAQRTAVTTLSGPLLVLAGAGTGKTRVITYRIAELIKSGVKPQRILAVTFTNKAAREMKERALGLLRTGRRRRKGDRAKAPEISTFHSLCVRILRRHATRLGYPEEFTIYDRSDQETVARAALRDIRVGHQKLRPSDLIQMVGTWKGQGLDPRAAIDRAQSDSQSEAQLLGALAYEKYQAKLRASGAMDFDDLLLLTERLFQEHPEARFSEASRFDHLLIDEYQDTNGLQYRIVQALAQSHRNLCVVGDDDQSIYGWRGAEVEHILKFREHWPEAKVVRLEENYRSTAWVIHLANTLIAHNTTRHDKKLVAARGKGLPPRFTKFEDENQEAEAVVAEIFGRINRGDEERVPASDIAILFRTNEQPRAFEQELRRAGVPYILVGGQSFYDRKEIKDLLSYLKVIANPIDEVSLLRVINTPARGIGTASVQTLLDEAVGEGKPLWKLLPRAVEHPDLSQGAAVAIDDFRTLIDEYRARLGSEPMAPLVRELIERIDYRSEIARQYKEPGEQEARWNAVEELVNAVANYEKRQEAPSLNGFLEESSLSNRDDDKDDDKRQEHAVTLMTLHSAKGLEFPIVYMVGLEEGLLPHKRSVLDSLEGGQSIEEERRLAYVGVTRAQDSLTLSFCKNRMKWGKLRPQIPSRFLMEMRGDSERAKDFASAAAEQIARDGQRLEERLEGKSKKKKGSRKRKAAKQAHASRERLNEQAGAALIQPQPAPAEKASPSSKTSGVAGRRQQRAKQPSPRTSPETASPTPAASSTPVAAAATPPVKSPAKAPSPPTQATSAAADSAAADSAARPVRPTSPDPALARPAKTSVAPSPSHRQPSAQPDRATGRGAERSSHDYRQVGLFGD